MKKSNLSGFLALALLLIGSPMALLAQTENNWTGNGTTANWSDNVNWDLPPLTDGDLVVFPGTLTNNLVNTNDTALTFGGITVNNEDVQVWGDTLTLNTNAPITGSAQAAIHEWNFNNDSLQSAQGLGAQFFGGDGGVLADTNGDDQYTVIRGDGFSGYRPFGWAANAGNAEKIIVSVTLSEFDISTTNELRFDIRLKSTGIGTNIAMLSFDGQSTNDVNNTSGFNRVRLTGSAGSTNPVASIPVGIALNTNASTASITYGLTLDFTDNSYTYWIGTPDSDGSTWVNRFAAHTGTNGVDLSTASIDGVQWGIQQAGGSGTVAPGDTFTMDQIQVYAVVAGDGATVNNDIIYTDAVQETANWQVDGVNGLLTLNGVITANQQGATNNSAATGYARKTGTGTLRLTGSGSQIGSGLSLKAGTLEMDGAGLSITNDDLKISHSSNNDAVLTVKNGASLDITGGNNLAVGSFSSDADNDNILNVDGGTVTIASPGALFLARSSNDTAVVNHNAGTVDLQKNSGGAGMTFIPNGQGGSTATYNLNGGILRVNRIIRNNPGSPGTAVFNFNGGTIEHALPGGAFLNFNFMQGVNDVNILAGGAIIDTAGNDLSITNDMDGVGGLTKKGAGQLRFYINATNAQINTFDGPVNVEEGTLRFANPSALGDNQNVITVSSNSILWCDQNSESGDAANLAYPLVLEGGATYISSGKGGRPALLATVNGPVTYDIRTYTSHPGSITNGSADAGITKIGTGTIQFQGGNTYTLPGSNSINAGTFRFNGDGTYGSLTVLDEVKLQGFNRFDGATLLKAGAEFGPGHNFNAANGQVTRVGNNSTLTMESGGAFPVISWFQLDSSAWTNTTVDALDPVTSDRVEDLQSVTYGGELQLVDVAAPGSYAAGQVYRLFSAESYSGTFDAGIVGIPTLTDPNLKWVNDIETDGTLRVVYNAATVTAPAPESLVTSVVGGTNLVVSWTDPKFWLEVQRNPITVGLSNNWSFYPTTGTSATLPITSTNGTIETLFVRLAFEAL